MRRPDPLLSSRAPVAPLLCTDRYIRSSAAVQGLFIPTVLFLELIFSLGQKAALYALGHIDKLVVIRRSSSSREAPAPACTAIP